MDCKKRPFLLEVGTEEMPHESLRDASEELVRVVEDRLRAYNIKYKKGMRYYTPRRLSLVIQSLDEERIVSDPYKKGPLYAVAVKKHTWTQAGLGFLQSVGVKDTKGLDPRELPTVNVKELSSNQKPGVYQMNDNGRVFIGFVKHTEETQTSKLLIKLLPEALNEMRFEKSMRWLPDSETSFLRPIRWLCCLYGTEVLPFEYAVLTATNKTFGHLEYPSENNTGSVVITDPYGVCKDP